MMLYKKFFILLLICFLSSCSSPLPKLKPLNPSDTILAFGDSITYGTGATFETSYPSNLEKMLGLKVINAGVPGEETRDSLKRIGQLLEQYHPKLVIVCLGGNDLIRKRPLNEIKENLKNIIQIIQKQDAEVVLIGVPRISYNLVVPGFYQELGEEFNTPVDSTSYRALIQDPNFKSDAIHLNAAGYQEFAGKIADLLRQAGAVNSH